MYEISVTKTNLGNRFISLKDNTGLNDEIIVQESVINSLTQITGNEEDAIKFYASMQGLVNAYNASLDIKGEKHDGPNYYSLIIERLVANLYECGISMGQIESVISELKESDLFGEIDGTDDMLVSEYVDAYAMRIANIIKESIGYNDDDNRRLEETFRGR